MDVLDGLINAGSAVGAGECSSERDEQGPPKVSFGTNSLCCLPQ